MQYRIPLGRSSQDAATTLRNAPRRLAFRKQSNKHPVEGIDDPKIAICAIAQSFLELNDLPTSEQRHHLHVLLRSKLRCAEEEAKEMLVLGRWLMTQCKSAEAAIPRLAHRLYKIDDGHSWDLLHDLLDRLVPHDLTSAQLNAIDDLRRAFRL